MRGRHLRQAITLVELLVVITIMATLAGIVALFGPRMLDSSRVPDGARQLQGWLQIARQRAVRDQAPRGLRLVFDSSISPTITTPANSQELYAKFVYIEQPDDVTVSPLEIDPAQRSTFQNLAMSTLNNLYNQENVKPAPNLAAFYQSYRDQVNPGMNPNGWKLLLWLKDRNLQGTFQRGDIVEFASSRYYLVTDAIQAGPGGTDSLLVLHRSRDETRTTSVALPGGRITRGMQPIAGEPELQLPQNVAIDVLKTIQASNIMDTRSWPAPDVNSTSSGTFDIVFSRTGEVTGALGMYGRIILWVRDYTLGEADSGARSDLPPGDNRLIVIHCRTGQVTAHPVFPDLDMSNPSQPKLVDAYKYIRDGKSSAME